MNNIRKCRCGSGLPRFEIVDAAGIFCAFACDTCEAEKKAKFDPRIFTTHYDADKRDVEFEGDY